MSEPADDELPARPGIRGDCAGVPRPCPYVGCRFNLFLEVSPLTGSIHFNFPDLEPDEMRESCALDIADRGGEILEVVGQALNLTRERIRQIEVRGLTSMARIARRPGSRLHAPVTDGGLSPMALAQQ